MSIFDGVAGALNSTFGAPVTIYPGGGAGAEIRAVFRHELREISDDEGGVTLSREAVFKAQVGDVETLAPGDQVDINGVSYRVSHREPNANPASDRFETFILRKESP